MLTYVAGSLFASPAQVLVNTVNTVGVMGKGIAKEFKAIYPAMFREYATLCSRGELTVGKLLLYRTPHKWVLNFPTKRHWKQKSRLEDIEAGLRRFGERYEELGIDSIAFPQLGCGNGQLDWESQVRPMMERYLGDLPIDVYIHVHDACPQLPDPVDTATMRSWLQSEPADRSFRTVWRDLVTLVRTGEACGWTIVDSDRSVPAELWHEAGAWTTARSEIFDLWHRLRTRGYLSLHDAPHDDGASAMALIELFERLDYVHLARFVVAHPSGPEPRRESVAALLCEAPLGVRYLPMIDAPPMAAQAAIDAGDDQCNANAMMPQLALFSTP